ncbi:MAG: pyridoxal phosphate-dependent decarboxylase family protein [Nannocystaceae bacterium]
MNASPPRPSLDPAFVLARPQLRVDATLARLQQTLQQQPILSATTAAELTARLPPELPRSGRPLAEVVDNLWPVVVAHARRNNAAGFHSYVCGSGLPTDPLAGAMAAALNQNVTGFSSAPGATTVEKQLLAWLVRLVGLGNGADGVLLSGGSLANFTAVLTALHHQIDGLEQAPHPGWLREVGLAATGVKARIYVASTAHFSCTRAAVMAGLGRGSVQTVPVDANHRMQVQALDAMLSRDREEGCVPVCVVATAGTTTLGRIDPLPEIADVCRAHGVWFHVDAAYGGAAMLTDQLRPRLRGIERADSVTLDLHKWFYMGFDASALLIAHPECARNVFYTAAEYVDIERDPPPERHAFFHLSPETSRRFRALAPMIALWHYGADTLGANIAHNAACARYLAGRVVKLACFELLARPDLSICCFRWCGDGRTHEAEVDRRNVAITDALRTGGRWRLSPTTVGGRPVLRVCVQAYSTTADDLDALLDEILRMTHGVEGSLRS